MKTAILYLGMAVVGYIFARAIRSYKNKFGWIRKLQSIIVVVLIFCMGMRMGCNSEVMCNLANIGIQSFAICVLVVLAIIVSSHVLRSVLNLNKCGAIQESEKSDLSDLKPMETEVVISKTTISIIIAVILGTVLGYFVLYRNFPNIARSIEEISGTVIMYILYFLVISVGFDMGLEENILKDFSKMGKKIVIFPVVTAFVTIGVVAAFSFFSDFSVKESLAISCTFCWYSLAPNIIMDSGLTSLGAIAFFSNFFRVLLSIFIIPTVAKKIGYIETICLPAAASMDVCISTIEQATNKQTAICAFISGAIYTCIIPIVMPIIVSQL